VYPVITAPGWLPTLFGPHRIGSKDQCLASFDGADTVAYAWYLDGVVVAEATGVSYTPPETSFGKQLSCSVTASNGGGDTEGTSDAFTLGVGPALGPTSKPYLHNGANRKTVEHGKVEKVNSGRWSPDATSFDYQWYVGSRKIRGETSDRFTPGSSFVGKKISCLVTAHRAPWTDGTAKTPAVKVT
jgi:hypothetical protein